MALPGQINLLKGVRHGLLVALLGRDAYGSPPELGIDARVGVP